MTTYEEAKRCPICGVPGEFVGERRVSGSRGKSLHTFICKNEGRCKWYDQPGWVVQVNPDGTIPEAQTNRPKQFPARPDRVEDAQRVAQTVLDQSLNKRSEVT